MTPTTLDVTTRCVILCVLKVLPSKVLLLEGKNVQTWMCVILRRVIFFMWMVKLTLSLSIVHIEFYCVLCEQTRGTTTMLICDQCSQG
jgi:hypothetical protein